MHYRQDDESGWRPKTLEGHLEGQAETFPLKRGLINRVAGSDVTSGLLF